MPRLLRPPAPLGTEMSTLHIHCISFKCRWRNGGTYRPASNNASKRKIKVLKNIQIGLVSKDKIKPLVSRKFSLCNVYHYQINSSGRRITTDQFVLSLSLLPLSPPLSPIDWTYPSLHPSFHFYPQKCLSSVGYAGWYQETRRSLKGLPGCLVRLCTFYMFIIAMISK